MLYRRLLQARLGRTHPGTDLSAWYKFKVEERMQDNDSKKVRYTERTDLSLSLPISLDFTINKAEVEACEAEKKVLEAEGKKMDPEVWRGGGAAMLVLFVRASAQILPVQPACNPAEGGAADPRL